MTHWNYRFCKQTYRAGTELEEVEISLREVYYNSQNEITGVTERAVGIVGKTVGDIRQTIDLINRALEKEILDMDTIVYASSN
jgi:hypothetical protein